MYKRVHSPHSPLMPLSPMAVELRPHLVGTTSASNFLSPGMAMKRGRIRRSFTPCHPNMVISPPSVSPIQKQSLQKKCATPDIGLRKPMVTQSAKTSIKLVRSSVRCAFIIYSLKFVAYVRFSLRFNRIVVFSILLTLTLTHTERRRSVHGNVRCNRWAHCDAPYFHRDRLSPITKSIRRTLVRKRQATSSSGC